MANFLQRLFSSSGKGAYHLTYIKRDGDYISLEDDTKTFCEKYIKPVQESNWNWAKRDFEKPENDPTIEEARAIRDLLLADMDPNEKTEISLTTINNLDALRDFFDPQNEYEKFNMDEFAYALKVELEHGKIKDANVTCNHPFLTALIVLAHMSESVSYYRRLKVMETEAEIFELKRKLKAGPDDKTKEDLAKAQKELENAKTELQKRLMILEGTPLLDKIGDE